MENNLEPADQLTEFKKNDFEKTMLAFLPVEELEQIAEVFDYGAKKYERHNWMKPAKWSRVLSACLRHIFAFMRGEMRDKESGLLHLAHAGCDLLMLMYLVNQSIGTNDVCPNTPKRTESIYAKRPHSSRGFYEEEVKRRFGTTDDGGSDVVSS